MVSRLIHVKKISLVQFYCNYGKFKESHNASPPNTPCGFHVRFRSKSGGEITPKNNLNTTLSQSKKKYFKFSLNHF